KTEDCVFERKTQTLRGQRAKKSLAIERLVRLSPTGVAKWPKGRRPSLLLFALRMDAYPPFGPTLRQAEKPATFTRRCLPHLCCCLRVSRRGIARPHAKRAHASWRPTLYFLTSFCREDWPSPAPLRE